MSKHEAPGVYIEEVSAFPPPIVEVDSAVPAFVAQSAYYPIYFALQMFFDNRGRRCYVASVGAYSTSSPLTPDLAALTQGLTALALEEDVTLIAVPEAPWLSVTDYTTLAATVLEQCRERRDRFAIFDLFDGANPNVDLPAARACFPDGRESMYGAVYYPDLGTTLTLPYVETPAADGKRMTSNASVRLNGSAPIDVASLAGASQTQYDTAVAAVRGYRLTIPPSGAIAGVYVANDAAHGVWQAPANAPLASVFAPVVMLTSRQAERLGVDPSGGKSVNTIRAFPGKGTLVWGARTLAGNDAEWKYVPVRRFLTVIEQSITRSTRWAVFEPNNANTWVRIRGVIENYLTVKWRDGALMGTTPREAFFVRCGLGDTMTVQDISDGRLIVDIGVAPARPAEFVVIRISHQVQAA